MREAQSCLTPVFANSTYQFFLSGTSTPANVYQNGTLTTPFPITGFVTSDSYGRFPPIYLDTSIIYKVQFYDNTNTLRWTVNSYTPPLATVGTSSNISYGVNIAPTGEVTIPAPNTGGTGISLTLKGGALGTAPLELIGTLAGNSALIVNSSATTGAQTATFAATNKPGTATSAPAGWLPITCDGVQYYTPIWHGNPFTPYAANPSANGETINASSVLFGGNGLTTATGGTATPGNWFSPTAANIGASYYINITKTGGLSGLAFSAAQGAWTNITSGGLTISSNAQAAITGTYQLSNSATGSPVVASGTITLSNNFGVQSDSYNGTTPIVLAGNGTVTLNGNNNYPNWYAPTTASIGASYYILITQTGGTAGYSFSTATSAYTNIGAGGLSIGVSGTGATTFSVTGTYIIASDSGGVNQLGSGAVTLTGSNVQSPNYIGTTSSPGLTALNLAGNGSATLNGAGTASWYSPNASNVGSGYWINITRNSGSSTSGVNFASAQGAWTNITNGGLTINISGTTGDVGTATAAGTYQISNSSSGSPVLGSGNISLSLSGLSVTHTYTSGSGTETVPTGASQVVITAWGPGGSGNSPSSGGNACGGGSGAYVQKTIAVTGGQTMTYTVGAGGAAVVGGTVTANSGGNTTVSGTVSGGSVAVAAGGGAAAVSGASSVAGGTASGGNTNTAGNPGTGAGGAGFPISGSGGNAPNGGTGGANSATVANSGTAPGAGGGGVVAPLNSGAGAAGKLTFAYS